MPTDLELAVERPVAGGRMIARPPARCYTAQHPPAGGFFDRSADGQMILHLMAMLLPRESRGARLG